MDNDDLPVGRVLSRREVLALFGAAGAALLAGCGSNAATSTPTAAQGASAAGAATATTALNAEAATSVPAATAAATGDPLAGAATAVPSCVVSPALTEGPYFVDEGLNRSDIRSDPTTGTIKDGAQFDLTMNVRQVANGACAVLGGALVDIWHCDAEGQYSDVTDGGFNTLGQKWLRGQQTTDANGTAKFTTIFPGWYAGRAVHIHFKVRTDAGSGQAYEFTSQLFFDPAMVERIYAEGAYSAHGTTPDTPNSADGIYNGGGDQLLVAVAKSGAGYAGAFDIGIDFSAPQQTGGPGGPPGAPRP